MGSSKDRARRGGSRRLWLAGALVGLLPAAAAATFVLPGAAGLSGRWPWAAVIAFRGVLAVGALVIAVPFGLAALGYRSHRRTRTVLVALTAVALLAAAGEVAVLGVRGLGQVRPVGGAPVDGITVVETNTFVSAADPAALVSLYLSAGADVVTMPETTLGLAGQVAAGLAAAGRPFQVFGVAQEGRTLPTALLISDRLGRYRQVNFEGNGIGEVLAEPVGGAGDEGRPVIVAVHPQAPISSRLTKVWRVDATAAIATCRDAPNAILGGDFNSTVDAPALRHLGDCFDVAQQAGVAGVATWPQGKPRVLGAPLDHIMATRSHWRAVAVWIEPIVGSDHRALLTRLLPVAAGTNVAAWADA